MRIAYIVLTCEKYAKTRVEWQKKHMFSSIDLKDVYYLGHAMKPDDRIYSWGAKDDYESLPYKFVDFFRNTDMDYDWYMLIDDDTFVYHQRLVDLLSIYNPNHPIAIGYDMEHLRNNDLGTDLKHYFSGGAGTALSRAAYRGIKQWITTATDKALEFHWCADISLGMWLTQVDRVHLVHSTEFHYEYYDEVADNIKKAITFHHLKQERHYQFYADHE